MRSPHVCSPAVTSSQVGEGGTGVGACVGGAGVGSGAGVGADVGGMQAPQIIGNCEATFR